MGTKTSSNTCLNQIAMTQNSAFMQNVFEKEITYAAATTGAAGATILGTITGIVAVQVVAVCTTDLTGAGTMEVGTADTTAGVIAQTTGTDIDNNEIWHDATPDKGAELVTVAPAFIITQDLIQTIAGGTITAGIVTYYIRWMPISADGNLVVA